MSATPKTDAELLQCSPRVDSAQFPKVLSNRIAQGYGKDTFLHKYKQHAFNKYNNKYNIYFCSKINFKQPVDFSIFQLVALKSPGCLPTMWAQFACIFFNEKQLQATSQLPMFLVACCNILLVACRATSPGTSTLQEA